MAKDYAGLIAVVAAAPAPAASASK